jgi:hypothetical protein
LKDKTVKGSHPALLQSLKKSSFLLDQHGALNVARDIYFPLPSNQDQSKNSWVDLCLLHPDVMQSVNNNAELYQWLDFLGVKYPTDEDIFEKSITPIIVEEGINESNAIEITRFIFRLYLRKKLTDGDYQLLLKFPLLLTNGNFALPEMCLLPNIYQPELKIENLLSEGNFIFANYSEQNEDIPHWREFFKRIGVRDRIQLHLYKGGLLRSQILGLTALTEGYLSYLDQAGIYPSNTYIYRETQHSIIGFYYVDFFELTSVYSFSKIFWKQIFEHWEQIKEMEALSSYKTMISNNAIISFFRFYCQHYRCVPGSDQKCYKSKELYSHSLKTILGSTRLFADFGFDLTGEQEHWLGLHQVLSIQDCIQLLASIEQIGLNENTQKQITAIFRQLLEYSRKVNDIHFMNGQNTSQVRLPAVDNSFQLISNLHGFGIPNINAPANSTWFLKQSTLKTEEYENLCILWDIPMVTSESLRCELVNKKLETELKSRLENRCTYLATLTSKLHNTEYEDEYRKQFLLICKMEFYSADNLSLSYKNNKEESIYHQKIMAWSEHEIFYYSKKWSSPTTWTNLKYKLAERFEILGKEDWLDIILLEEEPEIIEWLNDHGYPINVSPQLDIVEEPLEKYESASNTDSKFDSNENIEAIEENETAEQNNFIPTASPSEVKLTSVNVYTQNEQTVATIASTGVEMKDASSRNDVGRWGEELVFLKLIETITRKYQGYKYKTSDGIAQWDSGNKSVRLIWANFQNEKGFPYDLIIEDDGLSYIEVKSTTSREKMIIYLSGPEWQLMMEHGENYFIYRVFNTGTLSPDLYIIENPALKIQNGDILPIKIELLL